VSGEIEVPNLSDENDMDELDVVVTTTEDNAESRRCAIPPCDTCCRSGRGASHRHPAGLLESAPLSRYYAAGATLHGDL
jgi:hypothetical protein